MVLGPTIIQLLLQYTQHRSLTKGPVFFLLPTLTRNIRETGRLESYPQISIEARVRFWALCRDKVFINRAGRQSLTGRLSLSLFCIPIISNHHIQSIRVYYRDIYFYKKHPTQNVGSTPPLASGHHPLFLCQPRPKTTTSEAWS